MKKRGNVQMEVDLLGACVCMNNADFWGKKRVNECH